MTLRGVIAFRDWNYGGKYSPKSHGSTYDLQANLRRGCEVSRDLGSRIGIQTENTKKFLVKPDLDTK